MFPLINACGEKDRLQDYTSSDRVSLVVDCLIVAGLASLVCLVVIGQIDIGLPGPVGTIDNPWIQAMIGGGAGFFVADVITGVVKWRAGQGERETKQKQELTGTWISKLQPQLTAPKYRLEGLVICPGGFDEVQKVVERHCDVPYVEKSGPSRGYAVYRGQAEVKKARAEKAKKLANPSSCSDSELAQIANGIDLHEIRCTLSRDNLNVVFRDWYGLSEIGQAEYDEAVLWYNAKKSSYSTRLGCRGTELETMVLYHVLKTNQHADQTVAEKVKAGLMRQYDDSLPVEDNIKNCMNYRCIWNGWSVRFSSKMSVAQIIAV